ncbi:MAG: aminotransferase class V-fold PLP-dependent enzyme [Candidatus Krumholzibacteriota bacterium]
MSESAPLIYLDNAATSFPKPGAVAADMADFLAHRAVNPGRTGFDLSLETGRMVDQVRRRLDRLFNNPAKDPDRSIFTANATEAINLAIQGICRPGDHVVASVLEHNSVLRPLFMLRQAGIITYDLVGCDTGGVLDPEAFARLIKPATRLVIMTHASNVCGAVQPAAEVGALCRARGIMFLLDSAQTAGLIPVDMTELQADLVAFTGHKSLLGPTGTGGLVVGPEVDIRSTRWGGTGVRSALEEHPDQFPWRLEAGTLNTVGIAGLAAALDWIAARGPGSILDQEHRLAETFVAGCARQEKIRVHGGGITGSGTPGPDHLPVVSVTVAGRSPEEIGMFLDTDWNIAVRTGLHCAPLAHEALGTAPAGSVRFSFGPFNTDQDVATALEALENLSG